MLLLLLGRKAKLQQRFSIFTVVVWTGVRREVWLLEAGLHVADSEGAQHETLWTDCPFPVGWPRRTFYLVSWFTHRFKKPCKYMFICDLAC